MVRNGKEMVRKEKVQHAPASSGGMGGRIVCASRHPPRPLGARRLGDLMAWWLGNSVTWFTPKSILGATKLTLGAPKSPLGPPKLVLGGSKISSWTTLDVPWRLLETSFGDLGRIGGDLWASMGSPGGILGSLGGILGALGGVLGALGGVLGPSWEGFGAVSGDFWSSKELWKTS